MIFSSNDQRKTILIQPAYQIRVGLLLVGLISLVTLIYPMAIFDLVEDLFLMASKTNPASANKYKEQKISLINFLVILHILISSLVFVVSLFFTHKIAGPIIKIRNFIDRIREGYFHDHLAFRKGDHFPEIAVEINHLVQFFRDLRKNDFIHLSEIESFLHQIKGDLKPEQLLILEKVLEKVKKMQDNYGLEDESVLKPEVPSEETS